ncbi:MAG: hypothetical protein CBCREVIR_2132 [Candidatus Burkholderia crenata]|nr:MAG: hypothetical protein CBCREVIR_2132 [Candidatus Burkholderia crenata]
MGVNTYCNDVHGDTRSRPKAVAILASPTCRKGCASGEKQRELCQKRKFSDGEGGAKL